MSAAELRWFRIVALLEGVSFLVLLGVAMPLKYIAGLPLAVRVVGSAHGALFVAYVIFIGVFLAKKRWSGGQAVEAFVAGFLPFGTFWLDRKLKQNS
jgi:integral membrane protein